MSAPTSMKNLSTVWVRAFVRAVTSSALLGLACSSVPLRAAQPVTQQDVPALDLAAAACPLVVIGRALAPEPYGAVLFVDEVVRGTVPAERIPLARGVRLGLHEQATREARLLFLDEVRVGAAPAWRVSQFPGCALLAPVERRPALRALLRALDSLRLGGVGAASSVLAFAVDHAERDVELARIAMRALARRADALERDRALGLELRLASVLATTRADATLRAEAACALAALAPTRALQMCEHLLLRGEAATLGRRFAPLMIALLPLEQRSALPKRLVAMLDVAGPGAPGEILSTLEALRTVEGRRSFEALMQDARLRDAYRTHTLR